jgi:nucleotide-binding universal stress UspA family protein
MLNASPSTRIALKNILYLTDFSKSSEAALPFAETLARAHDAKMYAVHVLKPDVISFMTSESPAAALAMREKAAVAQMNKIDSRLSSVSHEALLERRNNLWSALDAELRQGRADLVVLGTHGRMGLRKFVMGSMAEKILRKSGVPVMTIGPAAHNDCGGKFRRLLLATDLKKDSEAAATYAISLAQETDADLVLLHVIHPGSRMNLRRPEELSVAEAMHRLQELLPQEAQLWCNPEPLVEHGQPGTQIVEVAKRYGADLIVLGIRNVEHLFAATHLGMRTAHRVIVHAACPVLFVPAGFVLAN